ncbi:head-tail adaptor protein [Rhizobium rhizogenes]|uniref:Phage head-tail adaptor n=1 Tax=Rhizobium rhizogenes NBRC 13257 TaxID=1220581 RepID=A0AA87Q460_RHIRH|nr:head-tail adaptor protein [Rhizobium rhizogenes]NTG67273.1 head-tail adaptor protein [Rhizobium rhizogenes]TRB14321.1 head-tail adaptor protein [Rhizobium rhizogenes]TRB47111.1 head-tail adaptor protein [Rhizobium rhizogenes]TRB64878.1 head-tail adaptor protein [Rhizobium rhizogenes]GAJ91034.1 putative phage head-tail adaptor [Rhizobium rhizogenes NBRC 13257]
MATKPGSGLLRNKLNFQRREAIDDGYGNEQSGDFATMFTAAAELIPLKGGEPVLAARLTGTQPFIIRIRSCFAAREVDTDWRVVDARNPSRIFNITAAVDPNNKNAWIEIMATQGVAT